MKVKTGVAKSVMRYVGSTAKQPVVFFRYSDNRLFVIYGARLYEFDEVVEKKVFMAFLGNDSWEIKRLLKEGYSYSLDAETVSFPDFTETDLEEVVRKAENMKK